jgi:hypothetical protein
MSFKPNFVHPSDPASDGRLGGRGTCKKCGRVFNNVSFHQANCDGTVQPVVLPEQLKGTFPVTLYFGSQADADGFILAIREARPGLKLQQGNQT